MWGGDQAPLVEVWQWLVGLAMGWAKIKKPTALMKELLLTDSISAGKSSPVSPTVSCTLSGFPAWCLNGSS